MYVCMYVGIKRHYKPADYLFVKYELLKDPTTRRAELRKVLDFLRIDPTHRKKSESLQPYNSVSCICMYVCMYVCVYMNLYMHTHIHIFFDGPLFNQVYILIHIIATYIYTNTYIH